MARLTIITCDNCGRRLDDGEQVTSVMTQEWCERCVDGTSLALHRMPFTEWPKLVARTDVRAYLEWRDEQDAGAVKELQQVQRQLQRTIREVEALRQQAAEGYAAGDMAKALSDIATNARRPRAVA